MRANIFPSFILLTVLPAVLARPQWHNNWGRPTRSYGPPAPPATVATQATQATYSTQGPPIATSQAPAPPETIQTGGGGTAQTIANTLPATGGGTATGTGVSQPSSTGTVDSTGAKGVIYDSGNAQRAVSLQPAWACDWNSGLQGASNPSFEFVPQLWGPALSISEADVAPYKSVLYYNEPDQCGSGGSCIPLQTTISNFNSSVGQFKGSKQISTPCVTNGGASYMTSFLEAFPHGYFDILCFHWYGTNSLSSLQSAVQTFKGLQQQYGASQLWITEMGDWNSPSDISQYTNYLDGEVDRYAYNLNYLGAGATSL